MFAPPEARQDLAVNSSPLPRNSGLSLDLRRLFLELGPEENRRFRVSELLQRSGPGDCVECLTCILERLVNFPSAQSLALHALYELLRLHREVLVQNLTSSRIYDLFNPNADERQPAMFLRDFLCCKESMGLSAAEEGSKLQRLLLRRSKQVDLRRVPPTPLRAGLSRIWVDVPSARPDQHILANCCSRWMGDPNTPQEDKLPFLALMRQERERRGSPDGDSWTVSMILEQVCRDPAGHSPDLQHLLWPLGSSLSPSLLKPLLHNLAQEHGRLATLWVCICLWAPQGPPQDGTPFPAWPQHPVHVLVRALMAVFAQLPNSSSLYRTCLLTLAAIAASGPGELAANSWDLLLSLYCDGILPTDAWLPLLPMAEGGQCPSSAELSSRIRRESGAYMGAPPAGSPPAGMGQMGPPMGAPMSSPMPTWM